MADGINIRIENGAKLDLLLRKMEKQRVATKVTYQSLNKGAAELRKNIKRNTPVYSKDSVVDGKNRSPIEIKKGQLKRSVKSGLRKKAEPNRHTFLAGVWFNNKTYGNAKDNADGWFAPFVIKRHPSNAFGYKGGNNFVRKAVKQSRSPVRRIIGTQLAERIAAEKQKEVNRL